MLPISDGHIVLKLLIFDLVLVVERLKGLKLPLRFFMCRVLVTW